LETLLVNAIQGSFVEGLKTSEGAVPELDEATLPPVADHCAHNPDHAVASISKNKMDLTSCFEKRRWECK
jgi:hypothetical protein